MMMMMVVVVVTTTTTIIMIKKAEKILKNKNIMTKIHRMLNVTLNEITVVKFSESFRNDLTNSTWKGRYQGTTGNGHIRHCVHESQGATKSLPWEIILHVKKYRTLQPQNSSIIVRA